MLLAMRQVSNQERKRIQTIFERYQSQGLYPLDVTYSQLTANERLRILREARRSLLHDRLV